MAKSCLLAAAVSLAAGPSLGATILADTVLDFFNSGAGPIAAGPFGGTSAPQNFPVAVPFSFATDGSEFTFISLPTDSFITLGFSSGYVFDGVGNDIFVSESGDGRELANVFISDDFGASFTFLGTAEGDQVTELDLASIGFSGRVNAIKIVGLDNGGGSPGFDVAFVQGLEGSVVEEPQGPTVIPLPPAASMLLGAFGALALVRRRV